jgi:aquaporin Z
MTHDLRTGLSLCNMRAMPIRVFTGTGGITQLKASFCKNWKHYLQEALGLAIFMISACFFGALLEGKGAALQLAIQNDFLRTVIMGVMMGSTAVFIFYSPWTSPSGSHINPAVTLTFLRLGKMCRWDAIFFIIFQFIGGTMAVYIMQMLIGSILTAPPVNSVATVPGKAGVWPALATEFMIAFITMSMVLFTSVNACLKKYTRMIAGCLVCVYVIVAGPISGFGMNPARSFASALPAHIWTASWIYMIVPITGMLCAAEFFLQVKKTKSSGVLHKEQTVQVCDPASGVGQAATDA